MPAIEMSTMKPETTIAWPDVRCGRFECRLRALAPVALLHLATHVEHRVVDADGEADEQDDRADLVGDRGELADRAQQAERRTDGRHAEQQRQACRDERAEGQQRNDQRERQRQRLGALEVVLERLLERLARRDGADLLDAQVRVRSLDGRGGRERRVDVLDPLVVVAGDLEGQQRRAPVLGDLAGGVCVERRDDLLDVREVVEALYELCGGGLQRGPGAVARSSLQQHLLTAGLAKARLVDREVGGLRRAVAHLGVAQRVRADHAAADRRGDDERDPAEDRDPSMLCAPAVCPCCEIRRSHDRSRGRGDRAITPFRGGRESLRRAGETGWG
jgi:hypothetical protein